jgi:hypothetical protein
MNSKIFLKIFLVGFAGFTYLQQACAQGGSHISFKDSVSVKIIPRYNSVSKIHKKLFGKNYREEWAASVKMPIIRISEINGGLTPVREGGGMQTTSLRLVDKNGRGWVMRSVKKTPENLLPANLKGTFIVDWFDDAMSSEHPYSALVVPPLAAAINVPHSSPVIGVVAKDAALGEYNKAFQDMVVLLEEREPIGKSDNTIKMESEILADHDNRIDGKTFLQARMLDLMIGDWDRHEDQWRWAIKKNDTGKIYIGVPRDRDQVFHLQEGWAPSVAAVSWINPTLEHFDSSIPRPKYSLYKTRFIQSYPDFQFTYQQWMAAADAFVKAETDSVLESGLKRLPPEVYQLRHEELFSKLKQRRNNVPNAMDRYFRFINETVDVRLTDKNEHVLISDAPGRGMRLVVNGADSDGKTNRRMLDIVYNPQITREIRIYAEGGDDQLTVNTKSSPIKLRMIGKSGYKDYQIQQSKTKVKIYSPLENVNITGSSRRYSARLSSDTLNSRFVQNNPYNIWMPLATAAVNRDDGFLLGAGFRYLRREGFRKTPYAMSQQLLLTHSFATAAFRINYTGEWMQTIGNADITINAMINAPNNTFNFFGQGNESALNKIKDYRRFYRTRYDTYRIDPAIRWHLNSATSLSAGPSFQYYHMDTADNMSRVINQRGSISSYDSISVGSERTHLGLSISLRSDHRDKNILPAKGYYLSVDVQAYEGLNASSKSFVQIKPELTWYQRIDREGILVLTDRIGGGISIGNVAFYQSMFLGGQGNLLGYLQNRFAGNQMVYNNFQARLRLFNIASYILPGQLGITGFNDTGRVWIKGEKSDKWHNGVGGGLYFAPASMSVIQFLAGHSSEGWYPYLSLNLRL